MPLEGNQQLTYFLTLKLEVKVLIPNDQHKFGFANWYQVFPSHALVCPLCQIFENNPQMQSGMQSGIARKKQKHLKT
jgi:hypothetical protein